MPALPVNPASVLPEADAHSSALNLVVNGFLQKICWPLNSQIPGFTLNRGAHSSDLFLPVNAFLNFFYLAPKSPRQPEHTERLSMFMTEGIFLNQFKQMVFFLAQLDDKEAAK